MSDLQQWKKEMREKYGTRTLNHIYILRGNFYLWYENDERQKRWQRLSHKEVLDLYIQETHAEISVDTWIENRTKNPRPSKVEIYKDK